MRIISTISKDNFQLIIVGTGAYVCGKKDDEYGTILLQSLCMLKFNLRITITFACNSFKGKENAEKKVHSLIKLVDIREKLDFEYVICDEIQKYSLADYRKLLKFIFNSIYSDQFHFKWISSILKRKSNIIC